MLYLAQVTKNPTSGARELQLLAHQQSETVWGVDNSEVLRGEEVNVLSEGLLVLVELGDNQEILKIKEAKSWVLNLIKKYLGNTLITSEMVQEEQARIEEWRQEITAKSLDLTRRHLELETQREQVQALETSLKQEKEELEARWQKLEELEAKLQASAGEN